MISRRRLLIALCLWLAAAGSGKIRAQGPERTDPIVVFLHQIEKIVQAGDAAAFVALTNQVGNAQNAREFAGYELASGVTRVVIQERDRENLPGTLPGNGYRLVTDLFIEYGSRARVTTWRLDIRKVGEEWRLADQERITSVENLYRLSLNNTKQYDAHDLTIRAEDVELRLISGSVFVSDTDQGATALVLIGNGEMKFSPRPDTEKGQVKIFCGSEALDSRFDTAFIRVNPGDLEAKVDTTKLVRRQVDLRDFKRADEVFRQEMPNSFSLDMGDLSRDTWSLLPGFGDFIAEVHTKRFDTLTYARSTSEAEDITLFDRKHRHNIALYASEQKLARRGRFYNEDDLADYDVLDYNIDLTVSPERMWLEGRATLKVRIRAASVGVLTLKLADPLVVQSVVAAPFGRLFAIRVRNQNSVVVNLPGTVPRDTVLNVMLSYAGRLEPQPADRETLQVGRPPSPQFPEDLPVIPPEPSFLYSNRSYWYPQGGVTDYATARIRLTIPAIYDCVASGDLSIGFPVPADSTTDPALARKVYQFAAQQPVRYLAFVVSRFVRTDTATVALPPPDPPAADGDLPPLVGVAYDTLSLGIAANPRQAPRGRQLIDRAADVALYYSALLGDCPYPSFTVALVENDLPGGHSPGYFAALNQPVPNSPYVWRNDPAAFQNYPEFFIAHEIAHQWWGQAVGWRNYHEQWLSEGFAQYFAAMYAQHHRGDEVFSGVMRQLRRWAIGESDQGPVYLGYRLGHIRNDSRVFRALVYNKGAAVLHMLRRLVGDEAFFRGLRQFYRSSRFKKVGTEDFRAAMEQAAGRPLGRFFEQWIYGSRLPRVKFSYRTDTASSGPEVVLHVEQVGELFDVPITVTLQYADRSSTDVVIPVTDRAIDLRVPLKGQLRSVDLRNDDGTLAEIVK